MPHASCAHCGTAITDHSTQVESGGKTYCCKNCERMAAGTSQVAAGAAKCAHCRMSIVDTSTQVKRGDQTFCCNNCATAMAAGGSHARS
jgi:hypothetical protein